MRQAIVLGAGMVGIGTALHLQQRGWAVTVVDRRGPGQETSYGNAGIIQSEAVSPHAMPRGVRRLLAMATGQTNDVHYHLGALPDHAEPLARYWWHSEPDRHRRISDAYARLIAAATAEHGALMAVCAADGQPVDGLVRREGFRAVFRDPVAFDEAVAEVEHHRQRWGVRYATLTPAELGRAEPALTQSGIAAIHGAIHWLDPWTLSDPGALVAAYAQSFVKAGGRLVQGDAATLAAGPGDGWSVTTDEGRVEAEAAVVALGPWSPALVQPLGYRFPMVRKRGYHQHYSGGGLSLPLLDADFGCVLAPMALGLRITTGAQLTHADAPADAVQLARAEAAARALLDLGDPVSPTPWFGTRPCMPDMLPVIGQAPRHPGLWLHFGHGHQGLTMGPASGRLLAELMSGERPFTDPDAFRPERR